MEFKTLEDFGLFVFARSGRPLFELNECVITFGLIEEFKKNEWYVEDVHHREVTYEKLKEYALGYENYFKYKEIRENWNIENELNKRLIE